MAKQKTTKSSANCPNKSLHSRVSFLYQAASYLTSQELQATVGNKAENPTEEKEIQLGTVIPEKDSEHQFNIATRTKSQQYLSDLRSVSQKMQIRLSPTMKHTICKRCDTMLIGSVTCTTKVENKSKNGKKSWADVLVQACNSCGFERRFPVCAERQKRRPHRGLNIEQIQAR